MNDDDVDDDELFLWYGPAGTMSKILTMANLRHAANMIWTGAESEFRLCYINLHSTDNHYTTAPLYSSHNHYIIF